MRSSLKATRIMTFLALLAIASISIQHPTGWAATPGEFSNALATVEDAFDALYNSQVQDYATVSGPIAQLGNATQLLNEALSENATDPVKASDHLTSVESIAGQVQSASGAASDSGLATHRAQTYQSLVEVAAVAASTGLVYVVSARVYNRWWMGVHRSYTVRLKRSTKSEVPDGSQNAGFSLNRGGRRKVAVAALLVLALVLSVSALQPIYSPFPNTQGNSQLGLLGPNRIASGYPTNVTQSKPFLLYGYLGNQFGTAELYHLVIKLGNQTTLVNASIPAEAPVVSQYYFVLDRNQTSVFPMELSLSRPGIQEKLIFELWSYQHSDLGPGFVYTGVFDQIILNVTAAP